MNDDLHRCLDDAPASWANMRALSILLGLAGVAVPGCAAYADQPADNRESLHYTIAPDYSYTMTKVLDEVVRKPSEVKGASQQAFTYDPQTEAIHVKAAWVEESDGTRRVPAPDAVFTRPSAASREAPGFVSSVTTTIVMPKVEVGSHVHYEIEKTRAKAPLMGFNALAWLDPFENGSEHVTIDIPAGLPLFVAGQGGFTVSDRTENGMRHIVADAELRNVSSREREPHMAPSVEFEPLFLATSLRGHEDEGEIYHRVNKDKARVTPEIEAMARGIVGERSGLEAARAIYDWESRNIRYLAVYRTDDDGQESHDAATVLKNGYGDCKDHVTLMQALLAAVGIRSEPALIDWSDRTKPLPLWSAAETNHAIIYLPDFDIFANPTSPFTPFGVLDQGLSGKIAILAGDHAAVRHTPAMTPETARFTTEGALRIAADGTVTGAATATMSPTLEPFLRSALQDPDENGRRIDRKLRATSEGGFGHLHTNDALDLDHPFELRMDWRSPHGVNPAAFVLPTPPAFEPIDEPRSFLAASDKRRRPIAMPVRDLVWTYSIALPPTRRFDAVPKPVDIRNAAGAYRARYENRGDTLVVHRELVLKTSELAADAYGDLEGLVYALESDLAAIVTTSAMPAQAAAAETGPAHT